MGFLIMTAFQTGPFTFEPSPRGLRRNGKPARSWTLLYGDRFLAEKTLPEGQKQGDIIQAFDQALGEFVADARETHGPDVRVELVEEASGEVLGSFRSHDMCGMTAGLIDDRHPYWIRSATGRYSRPVTISDFAALAVDHAAPENSWIAGLLPDEVLTTDPDVWRAPSSWEIRHVVGEGSFTGISGATAAKLVGVTPQNFRKYFAADSAKTRQKMSFAMWHYLLTRLHVTR
jgi:hypothetical protein